MSNTRRKTKKIVVEEEEVQQQKELINVDEPVEMLRKWLRYEKPRNVHLSQMTKRGTYRLVTEEGKKTIEQQITKMGGGNFDKGLDYSEPFLIQELPEEEKKTTDKKPEYLILGGNHRFEIFRSHDIEEWPCVILKPSLEGVAMSEEEREVLAGANNAKNQDGTAKAPWFEYLEKLIRYLEMPGVQVKAKGKKLAVNWERIHQLSGKRDGLALDSAKKLYTAFNKLSNNGAKDVTDNAVYKKLKELHLKYGFGNPIKLSCVTENKAFWKLDDVYKLAAIEEFVQWAAKNNKASMSEFSGIVARRAHIVAMVDYVKKQSPNADLLEEYVEAMEAGKFEALETATANNFEGEPMASFIKDLNASVPIKNVKIKGATEGRPVPKSPTAAKNIQQANEKLTKERLPVDLPILSKESSRKRDREPAANIESEPPPKKSRTNKDADEGAVITVPGDEDSNSEEVDDTVPFRKELIENVENHFEPHFRTFNSYTHIKLAIKADLIFLVLDSADQFRNSLLQTIINAMHISSRVVILAAPDAAYSIFHSLSNLQNPLLFEFKYTACISAPPVKSFTQTNPIETTWDFYFLRLRTGSGPYFGSKTPSWVKHGHYNPNWQHGIFKTPPASEMLREKLSLSSAALYPHQPPVQVLSFIFSVFCPSDGIIFELNNLSGTGYIAAALSSRSYVGYITNTPLKKKIKDHVCRVLSRSVADPQAAIGLSASLAVSSLSSEGTSQPSTPHNKGFLPDAFDEPLVPVTPGIRGTTPMPKFNVDEGVQEARMSPTSRRLLQQDDD